MYPTSIVLGGRRFSLTFLKLAASSLSFSDVTKMFRLKINVDDSYNVWKLAESALYDIPITLCNILLPYS